MAVTATQTPEHTALSLAALATQTPEHTARSLAALARLEAADP